MARRRLPRHGLGLKQRADHQGVAPPGRAVQGALAVDPLLEVLRVQSK